MDNAILPNSAAPTAVAGNPAAPAGDLAANTRVNPFGNVGSFAAKHLAAVAGNDAQQTVTAGKKWVVKSVCVTLVTNATVATRTVILGAQNGANIYAVAVAAFTQAASLTVRYCFAPNVTNMAAAVATNATVGFPEVNMNPGDVLRTFVNSLQAGDTVTLDINVLEISD